MTAKNGADLCALFGVSLAGILKESSQSSKRFSLWWQGFDGSGQTALAAVCFSAGLGVASGSAVELSADAFATEDRSSRDCSAAPLWAMVEPSLQSRAMSKTNVR